MEGRSVPDTVMEFSSAPDIHSDRGLIPPDSRTVMNSYHTRSSHSDKHLDIYKNVQGRKSLRIFKSIYNIISLPIDSWRKC